MDDTTDVRGAPPPPPPPPPPPAPRRFQRRPEPDAKIGGVCAGIADLLGVDVTLVRIAFAVLALTGPGLVVYVLLWVIVPKAPEGTPASPVRYGPTFEGGTNQVIGIVLVLGALLLVFDGDLFFFDRGVLLPTLLVGGGIWLLVRDRDEPVFPASRPAPPASPAPAPPPAGSTPPAPAAWPVRSGTTSEADLVGGGGEASGEPTTTSAPTDPSTTTATGASAAPTTWTADGPGQPPWWSNATLTATPPPTPPPTVERSHLGRIVLGGVLVAVAVLWGLAASDAVDPDVTDVLAVGVLVVGAGLLVGSVWGRARWLVVPGVVLVALLTAAAAVDVPLQGGVGERSYQPLLLSDLDDPFRLAAGELRIDLLALDRGETGRATVEASVGAGQLEVLVPEDVTVELVVDIGAGELLLPDDPTVLPSTDVPGLEQRTTLRGVEGEGTIVLDLEVGVGEVVVTRG